MGRRWVAGIDENGSWKGNGDFVNTTSKAYLFAAIFSLCLVFFLLLPVVYDVFAPSGRTGLWLENSENSGAEFLLLVLISTLTAFGLTSLINSGYVRIRNWRRYHPKIGEILKEQGAISEKELRWALNEKNKKLGVILKEMSLVTDFDIDCALMLEKKGRMDKSGNIIDIQ
jgi:hypothetical protein